MKEEVIFLIESKSFDTDLMRMSLEKLTNCKVFDFFSFEEAILYTKLNPKAIIYSSDQQERIHTQNFPHQVDFINIATRVNQEGKDILLKHTSLADKLASMLGSNLN